MDPTTQLYLLWGVVLVFSSLTITGMGFVLGTMRANRRFTKQAQADREEMLVIERALKEFWDTQKQAMATENEQLQQRAQFLEGKLEQYRRKAAGIGLMGLGKGKRTDMLISLLLEIEALEEKLFMQNVKLKREMDENLERELKHISYKRILLSEIVQQDNVRREIDRFLRSGSAVRRLDALTSSASGAMGQHTALPEPGGANELDSEEAP